MSLIEAKFPYKTITRTSVNGRRLYNAPNGGPVPSVTTVLDATKDKTHLIEWRKRVGEQKAKAITTEASGVGTRMHKYLEDYIETGNWPLPGSNPYAQQAHKMAEVIRENAFSNICLLYTSPSPRDKRQSRMPSSA